MVSIEIIKEYLSQLPNMEIAQIRVKEAIETQADVLLTAWPSSNSYLKIDVQALNSDIQVLDLFEFILEGL